MIRQVTRILSAYFPVWEIIFASQRMIISIERFLSTQICKFGYFSDALINRPATTKHTNHTKKFVKFVVGSQRCTQVHFLSCGTVTMAVSVLLFPALSVAIAVMV